MRDLLSHPKVLEKRTHGERKGSTGGDVPPNDSSAVGPGPSESQPGGWLGSVYFTNHKTVFLILT